MLRAMTLLFWIFAASSLSSHEKLSHGRVQECRGQALGSDHSGLGYGSFRPYVFLGWLGQSKHLGSHET